MTHYARLKRNKADNPPQHLYADCWTLKGVKVYPMNAHNQRHDNVCKVCVERSWREAEAKSRAVAVVLYRDLVSLCPGE